MLAILESILERQKSSLTSTVTCRCDKAGELIGRLVGERENSLMIAPNAYQPLRLKINAVAAEGLAVFPNAAGPVNSWPGRKYSTFWRCCGWATK